MAKYKLLLPKMGESVAEATIIKWVKNVGDHIAVDETVMEIATDKVDSEVPSPVAGKMLERFFNENEVVQIGSIIAIIETSEAEETKESFAPPIHQPASEQAPSTQHEHSPVAFEQPRALDADVKAPNEFKPPVLAESHQDSSLQVPFTQQLEHNDSTKANSNASGRFYSPLVKNIASQEGISNTELDAIPGTGSDGRLTKDDLLLYIQNRHLAAPVKQRPAEQLIEPVLPEVIQPEKTSEKQQGPGDSHGQHQQSAAASQQSEPVTEPKIVESGAEHIASAAARQDATENKATSGNSLSGGDEIIEMDRMRRLIADHMVMSKHTSPHVTSFVEADVTNLVLWRERIKPGFEKREGEKITFTPIFIEAVVRAIKDLPMINIQVNGTQIIKKKDINISMATALPNGNLIVPVIKKADELNLVGLTKAVNDLASRARENKLKPDDVYGGTFTITNVGTFGNVMGTPIINQPQVAILAVGAIRKKPAVIETLQGDMIGIRHMMFLSLSYDHRVVDGALGGMFVKRVADYLENWDTEREF